MNGPLRLIIAFDPEIPVTGRSGFPKNEVASQQGHPHQLATWQLCARYARSRIISCLSMSLRMLMSA